MDRRNTRQATLHRLRPRVRPSHDSMYGAYIEYETEQKLDDMHAVRVFIEVAGAPAVWISWQGDTDLAEWCKDAAVTTGLDVPFTDCRSGGVLLLGVDDTAYAMSYGAGYASIPDKLKDKRFGLQFLIRRLDPSQVKALVRRRPDARGRTDSTAVPAGAPVWTFGIAENAEIVRRIGGRSKDLKTTFGQRDTRAVTVEGSAGLRMQYAIEPHKLVSDIRECERICREEEPDPALTFIEHIQPVTDPATLADLDSELEGLLDWDADLATEYLLPVVPVSLLGQYADAHSFSVRIGHARLVPRPSLELEDILHRTRRQPDGGRLSALRTGRVTINGDSDGRVELGHASADRWIEASISLGHRRFAFMDGDWIEIGADYAKLSRDEIAPLFPVSPTISLPAWSLLNRRTERDYNQSVADCHPGQYLCLDRNSDVRSPLGVRSSLEICDLLGPGNELIHVKRARRSAPLSHLFYQGLVSAESLISGPDAVREQFAKTVAALPRGRVLPVGFKPKKVVYAILLESGEQLSPDTLFPFSQASLAHAARVLRMYAIDVEVIGIPPI